MSTVNKTEEFILSSWICFTWSYCSLFPTVVFQLQNFMLNLSF